MHGDKKIIVVGGGFGGLSIAIRLRAQGHSVTLLEKRSELGGRAYQLRKAGYTFDMGPSLITAPFLIESIFELAGKQLADYLQLVELDPFYRVYFHDGEHLDYVGDSERMKQQMAKFSKADAERYDDFFNDIRGIYDAVITDGLGSKPFLTISSMLQFLPRALKLRAMSPVYNYVSRYFKHPHHRFLFSFQSLFIGGSPFKVPSIYLMIPYLERDKGVWFAKGGMYSLVQAMAKLFREMGGEVKTNCAVEEVLIKRRRAVGVRTPDGELPAEAVVCNSDLVNTYRQMVARGRDPVHQGSQCNGAVDRGITWHQVICDRDFRECAITGLVGRAVIQHVGLKHTAGKILRSNRDW